MAIEWKLPQDIEREKQLANISDEQLREAYNTLYFMYQDALREIKQLRDRAWEFQEKYISEREQRENAESRLGYYR